jgi:hypothetical protein
MICPHKYYKLVNGELVCIQCGEPARHGSEEQVEDKAEPKPEDKAIWPAEVKRQPSPSAGKKGNKKRR